MTVSLRNFCLSLANNITAEVQWLDISAIDLGSPYRNNTPDPSCYGRFTYTFTAKSKVTRGQKPLAGYFAALAVHLQLLTCG
jgi:hypothetical protein